MARYMTFLAVLNCLLTAVLSAALKLQITGSTLLPNPNTLPSSTHAILISASGETLQSVLRKDNTILFPSISTTGTHLLKIYTKDIIFAQYRIDTVADGGKTYFKWAAETYLGSPWTDLGPSLLPVVVDPSSPATTPETLTIHPKVLAKKSFYEDRPGFSPLVLLKNPMILMGIVALAFTFGMPKLMENMDPEMKAEYEEMQKNSPMAGLTRAMQGQGPASSGESGFDLAGYLAGQSVSGAGNGGTKASGRDVGNIRERRK